MTLAARLVLAVALAGAGESASAPEAPVAPQGASAARSVPSAAALPWREFRFELATEPASHYGRAPRVEADRRFADLVAGLAGVRYDGALGRAAREAARFQLQEGEIAPSGTLAFLLAAAGAAEWGVQQAMLEVTPGDDRELLDMVREMVASFPEGSPPVRVGIGEVMGSEPRPRRHLAVLLSASGLELEPVPVVVASGQTVALRFRLPAGWSRPEVLVLDPRLELGSPPVRPAEPGFAAEVAAGDAAGALSIEIVARGPDGPAPLAQLELQVDRPAPRVHVGRWPPDESGIKRHQQAADLVYQLLLEDRHRAGLADLARDPALDAIARAHSRDMRDRGWIGHVSPQTGSPADRLRKAGYRAIAHGENVARDGSLYEAEERLLVSLGHRRNILSSGFSRVGIGVSLSAESGSRLWYVTQLFARPAPVIEPVAASAQALAATNRARAEHGLRPLLIDPALARLAQDESERAAPSPQRVLAAVQASSTLTGSYWAGVFTLPELGELTLPEPALSPLWRRVGIGVHQDRGLDPPEISLVLLVGE